MVLDKRISQYRDAEDNKGGTAQFSHVLNAIKAGRWKEKVEKLRFYLDSNDKASYDEGKRYLPAITFSGQVSVISPRLPFRVSSKNGPTTN